MAPRDQRPCGVLADVGRESPKEEGGGLRGAHARHRAENYEATIPLLSLDSLAGGIKSTHHWIAQRADARRLRMVGVDGVSVTGLLLKAGRLPGLGTRAMLPATYPKLDLKPERREKADSEPDTDHDAGELGEDPDQTPLPIPMECKAQLGWRTSYRKSSAEFQPLEVILARMRRKNKFYPEVHVF